MNSFKSEIFQTLKSEQFQISKSEKFQNVKSEKFQISRSDKFQNGQIFPSCLTEPPQVPLLGCSASSQELADPLDGADFSSSSTPAEPKKPNRGLHLFSSGATEGPGAGG